MVDFKAYPCNKPSSTKTFYLVIIQRGLERSFAFRYFETDMEFEKQIKSEKIIAFTETDPHTVPIPLGKSQP